jgi:hypothetical protein
MCDYSLHAVASRPAKIGDQLITIAFPNTVTRGFCALEERHVAVCLLPSTEIAFEKEAESRHSLAKLLPSFGFGNLGASVACFRQINTQEPHTHDDALEFANGRMVLITHLSSGQRATVLQLPVRTQRLNASSNRRPPRLPRQASARHKRQALRVAPPACGYFTSCQRRWRFCAVEA